MQSPDSAPALVRASTNGSKQESINTYFKGLFAIDKLSNPSILNKSQSLKRYGLSQAIFFKVIKADSRKVHMTKLLINGRIFHIEKDDLHPKI